MTALLFQILISAAFADVQVENGEYQWLRINTNGLEDTHCIEDAAELRKLAGKKQLDSRIIVNEDTLVSAKGNPQGCRLIEHVELGSLDGKIAKLELKGISSERCKSIDELRSMNFERPFDDENLNFISSKFKFVQISRLEEFVEFKRGKDACFYAVKK